MRKDWEYKKLGEVCETSSGGTPSKTYTEYYENGTIPWLRSGEVSQGYIYDAEIYISELGLNKSSAKIFPKGTVLIAMYGATVGEVGILCNPMCTNQAICGVLPNDLYNSEFLRYVLLSHKDKYLSLAIGGAQPNISQQIIKNTLIPLIDKSTQLSIVAELDKINELIQLKKQQLKDYDQLAQSIFYEMFGDPVENEKGWEVKKLGDICEVTSAKRVFIEEVVDSGVPFIRGTELTALNRLTRGEKMKYSLFITKEHYERLKAITGVPKYGDLLIPSINSEGIAWIVNTEEPLYFKDGRVLWVHVNQDVFKSECLQKIMNILLKHTYKSMGGATFSELKLFVLRELKVPIPPIESQQQFAARIEAIERQKQQVSETIKDLETLLASRMQYWFD